MVEKDLKDQIPEGQGMSFFINDIRKGKGSSPCITVIDKGQTYKKMIAEIKYLADHHK